MLHLRPLPPGTPEPSDDDTMKRRWRAGTLAARPDVVAVFRSVQPTQVATPAGMRLVLKRSRVAGDATLGGRG